MRVEPLGDMTGLRLAGVSARVEFRAPFGQVHSESIPKCKPLQMSEGKSMIEAILRLGLPLRPA